VPTAQASADDDAVYVDSPTTHYHQHGPPLVAIVATIACALVVTALLIAIAWVTLSSRAALKVSGPAPAPAERPSDYLEFFEP
jgi:hypothetical protein